MILFDALVPQSLDGVAAEQVDGDGDDGVADHESNQAVADAAKPRALLDLHVEAQHGHFGNLGAEDIGEPGEFSVGVKLNALFLLVADYNVPVMIGKAMVGSFSLRNEE